MNVRSVHPIMYVAPEMYQSRLSNPRADVYSWGVVVYQMLCGSLPWRIDRFLSPEGQKQQSMSRSIIMPEILGKEVPDWMFTLLLSCLKGDPRERPSLSELAKLLSDRGISSFVSHDKEDFTEFNQAAEVESIL
jgi:serine/threonine protein kinase